jgi:hypothetical protein
MGVTAGIFLALILLKEMCYLVYIRYLWLNFPSILFRHPVYIIDFSIILRFFIDYFPLSPFPFEWILRGRQVFETVSSIQDSKNFGEKIFVDGVVMSLSPKK